MLWFWWHFIIFTARKLLCTVINAVEMELWLCFSTVLEEMQGSWKSDSFQGACVKSWMGSFPPVTSNSPRDSPKFFQDKHNPVCRGFPNPPSDTRMLFSGDKFPEAVCSNCCLMTIVLLVPYRLLQDAQRSCLSNPIGFTWDAYRRWTK